MATSAGFALVTSDGGYSTNLPLEDLVDDKAWIAFGDDDAELEAEHGAQPGCWWPTCTWKSAKWVGGVQLGTPTSPASGRASATTTPATLAPATLRGD